jgi:hypothetical protein
MSYMNLEEAHLFVIQERELEKVNTFYLQKEAEVFDVSWDFSIINTDTECSCGFV